MPPSDTATAADVIHAALRNPAGVGRGASRPRLLVAGATGALGSEVLRRLAGSGQYEAAVVLTREPMTAGLSQVHPLLVSASPVNTWTEFAAADVAVVMFEPPRLYHDRERAFWTPTPDQLPALADWLRQGGVHTLVVVVPHAQGQLPEALKRGLANLDEQAIASLGFARLLLIRSAQKVQLSPPGGWLNRLAASMLSIFGYMLPATEQPVRPARLADFIETALRLMPPGTHIAAPELLWRMGQERGRALFAPTAPVGPPDMQQLVKAWLDLK